MNWLNTFPETHNEPAWLSTLRQSHWDSFLKHGLPTRRDERFKYTNFSCLEKQDFKPAVLTDFPVEEIQSLRLHQESILLVFINGFFFTTAF